MNIVLLITTCMQNTIRIYNQLANLKTLTPSPKFTVTPVFVVGGIHADLPFDKSVERTILHIPIEEKYTNLHKKLFESYKHIDATYNYDFIW